MSLISKEAHRVSICRVKDSNKIKFSYYFSNLISQFVLFQTIAYKNVKNYISTKILMRYWREEIEMDEIKPQYEVFIYIYIRVSLWKLFYLITVILR